MTDIDSLDLVIYPHPSLLGFSDEVDTVDDEIVSIANRMIEVMLKNGGIGIAAPQIGIDKRIFVAWAGSHLLPKGQVAIEGMTTQAPVVFINPRLSHISGKKQTHEEGCLSLPGINIDISRQPYLTIKATGIDGKEFEMQAKPPLSLIIQHENDHLNGILISNPLKCGIKQRKEIESELTKLRLAHKDT